MRAVRDRICREGVLGAGDPTALGRLLQPPVEGLSADALRGAPLVSSQRIGRSEAGGDRDGEDGGGRAAVVLRVDAARSRRRTTWGGVIELSPVGQVVAKQQILCGDHFSPKLAGFFTRNQTNILRHEAVIMAEAVSMHETLRTMDRLIREGFLPRERVQGEIVQILTDNISLLHCLEQRDAVPETAPVLHACQHVRACIHRLQLEWGASSIRVHWVPREFVRDADAITHSQDLVDQRLMPRAFRRLWKRFGPFDVDWMASTASLHRVPFRQHKKHSNDDGGDENDEDHTQDSDGDRSGAVPCVTRFATPICADADAFRTHLGVDGPRRRDWRMHPHTGEPVRLGYCFSPLHARAQCINHILACNAPVLLVLQDVVDDDADIFSVFGPPEDRLFPPGQDEEDSTDTMDDADDGEAYANASASANVDTPAEQQQQQQQQQRAAGLKSVDSLLSIIGGHMNVEKFVIGRPGDRGIVGTSTVDGRIVPQKSSGHIVAALITPLSS